jgi:hypothetical protein
VRELRPLIQIIDDWNTGRKLALAFECKVGSGRLLGCGADLARLADRSPAARQLWRSLLAYVADTSFNPAVSLTADRVQSLLALESPANRSPQGDKPLTNLTPDN